MSVTDALDRLYRMLPTLDCQKKCQEACGPIPMTKDEYDRLAKRVGHALCVDNRTFRCPLLKDGLCTTYMIRPLICRLWGLVDNPIMRCPHGCQPSRWLTDAEAGWFLDQTMKLSGGKMAGIYPTTRGAHLRLFKLVKEARAALHR